MKKIGYFDYQNVARNMKVPASIIKKIEKEVKGSRKNNFTILMPKFSTINWSIGIHRLA